MLKLFIILTRTNRPCWLRSWAWQFILDLRNRGRQSNQSYQSYVFFVQLVQSEYTTKQHFMGCYVLDYFLVATSYFLESVLVAGQLIPSNPIASWLQCVLCVFTPALTCILLETNHKLLDSLCIKWHLVLMHAMPSLVWFFHINLSHNTEITNTYFCHIIFPISSVRQSSYNECILVLKLMGPGAKYKYDGVRWKK